MNPTPSDEALAARSREVALACDPDGVVTWVDPRAMTMLGARTGARIESLAVPGSEAKVHQLVAQARQRDVDDWELAVMLRGAPATVSFSASRHGDGVLLVGNLVPERYGVAMGRIGATLAELAERNREVEAQQQELARRHEELLRVHRELSDSNKGVVALHAELDVQAGALHRMSESRSRVVASVSHEFRTPVNSIIGLTSLLLSGDDGPLSEEQMKQVGFIRRSAEALSTLVNDLLDISKIEAGKLSLRTLHFTVSSLFGALRGMLRPVIGNPDVALEFDETNGDLELDTDEGKVSQVMRNLISNALKYTERGSVTVRAVRGPDDRVVFTVTDTGIGIARDDQRRVFEEFTQLDHPLQAKTKGSGLGLSLSSKLAEMLGGELTVASEGEGHGSTFTLDVPRVHPDVTELSAMQARSARVDPTLSQVLVVEDDTQTLFLYEKYLRGAGFQVVPTRSVDDARRALRRFRPAAVVLDVMLEGEASWGFLSELKASPDTRDIPTLIVTVTDREQKARALGADEFVLKPLDRGWLVNKLTALARRSPVESVLVIDDDEVARYLVRKLLTGLPYEVLEASTGSEGVRVAREKTPGVIILDFVMPEMSAFEVLDELKRDPRTRSIPVIINTSETLTAEERQRLSADTSAILSKQSLSREVAIARIREALLTAGVGRDGKT